MIKVTIFGTGEVIYLNSFWIENMASRLEKGGGTRIYIHGDTEGYYQVKEPLGVVLEAIKNVKKNIVVEENK